MSKRGKHRRSKRRTSINVHSRKTQQIVAQMDIVESWERLENLPKSWALLEAAQRLIVSEKPWEAGDNQDTIRPI